MSAFGFLEDFLNELRGSRDVKICGKGRRNETTVKQGEKISKTRLGDISRGGQRKEEKRWPASLCQFKMKAAPSNKIINTSYFNHPAYEIFKTQF